MVDVRWTWLFLDVARADRADSLAFWTAVSRTARSPWRGDDDEFTTLEPDDEPAWLKFQLVGGTPGVHLDLDVDDPLAAAATAERLGARVVARPDHVVMASPGGFAFCLTHAGRRPERPAGTTAPSRVDQVCIDVPAEHWDRERRFWSRLLQWPRHRSSVREEFDWFERPADLPVRILLQRLDEPRGRVRGHVDIASVDRAAEATRHEGLGATVLAIESHWTVLRDPVGRIYCITDRNPETGNLP